MALIETQVRARAKKPPHGICDPELYRSQPWHMAYLAALFETDRSKADDRIMSAEQLIHARENDLRDAPADRAELNLLSNALSGLRALRTCLHLQSMRAKCG